MIKSKRKKSEENVNSYKGSHPCNFIVINGVDLINSEFFRVICYRDRRAEAFGEKRH